jgi:hypothetical protein
LKSLRSENDPMLARLALAALLATAPLAAQQEQEKPKVPKDSLLVVVTGCIKGRIIRAADVRQTDTTSGYNIRNSTFRLEGKKDVKKQIEGLNEQRAEVTGLIKKSSLIEPGVKFKGGRVVVGGTSPGATPGTIPSPAENVVVLDAISAVALGGSCGG